MKNFKKMFPIRSSRMFLYSSIYAFGAAFVYVFGYFPYIAIFAPATGYLIKGYYYRHLEVKFK